MFDTTAIERLRQGGFIGADDIAFFCSEAPPTSAAFFGGAIGAAIASSSCGAYVMMVRKEEIKLFEIDKKTGFLTEGGDVFRKADIKKLSAGSFLGSYSIVIKCDRGTFRYNAGGKYRGYNQKDVLKQMKEFVKENYAQ